MGERLYDAYISVKLLKDGERAHEKVSILFKAPAVKRLTKLHLVARLHTDEGEDALLNAVFQVYPTDLNLPWKFLESARIGIFDPSEKASTVLKRLGGALGRSGAW